jgi:membrane dipeptidase
MKQTSRPFIASHSNAKALCDHARNLDDDQLRAVASRGGVCGVAFEPSFLAKGRTTAMVDVLRHVDHMVEVAGIDHVGIGSDFDGTRGLPEGLEDVSKFPELLAELARRGWSDGDLRKLMGENVLRVMRRAEAVARR